MLLANGHTDAPFYSLGQVIVEAELVEQRNNQNFATAAILTQMAVAALLDKDDAKAFTKAISDLSSEA